MGLQRHSLNSDYVLCVTTTVARCQLLSACVARLFLNLANLVYLLISDVFDAVAVVIS